MSSDIFDVGFKGRSGNWRGLGLWIDRQGAIASSSVVRPVEGAGDWRGLELRMALLDTMWLCFIVELVGKFCGAIKFDEVMHVGTKISFWTDVDLMPELTFFTRK